MMNISDDQSLPWKPHEKLELLTEIIKAANIHPDILIPLVRTLPGPSWIDVPLPRGRTLLQCQTVYDQMLESSSAPPQNPQVGLGVGRSTSVREAIPRTREFPMAQRPQSMLLPGNINFNIPQYQEIQPKPTLGASAGTVRPPSLSGEPPKKRRGRPPKAETEARRANAAQARANLQPLQPRRDIHPMSPSMSQHPQQHQQQQSQPASAAAQAAQAVMTPTMFPGSRPSMQTAMSSADQADVERRRARLESLVTARRYSEEEEETIRAKTSAGPQSTSGQSSAQRSPTRGYPDILSRDAMGGPSSSFRAPR